MPVEKNEKDEKDENMSVNEDENKNVDKSYTIEERQNFQILDLIGEPEDDLSGADVNTNNDDDNIGDIRYEKDSSEKEKDSEPDSKEAAEKDDKTGEDIETQKDSVKKTDDVEKKREEEVGIDKGDSDGKDLKEQNRILLERVENLSKKLLEKDETSDKIVNVPDDDEKINKEIFSEDFLGDLDIDDVASDKDLFNKVLLKVVDVIEQRAGKKYANNISGDVKQFTDNHIELKELVDVFYKENQDLISVKSTVQAAAVDVIKNNPNMKIIDVFNNAAINARKILGIKKIDEDEKISKNSSSQKAPALVKKTQGSNKQKSVKKTKLQGQIDELL